MTNPSRVLVVEDDPSVRGLLHTLLTAEGYEVSTASDGLILLDLMMPDLGGVRVLEELRDDPELDETPVVVVTGQVDAVPGMRRVLGDDNVFVKPFAVAELLARVATITGGPEGRG